MFNLLPCPNSIRYSWFWSGPQRQTRGDSSLWPPGTVTKLPSGTSPGPPQNPKSKIPKIQNPKIQNPKIPKSPKSKIPKIPKSKIQNPQNPQNPKSPKSQNPKSKIPKIQNPQNPKIQNPQNPKSKIPKIQNPNFFGRILGILDFGSLCSNSLREAPNAPNCGFWILGILDFGDFGFWGFWILGILDFGEFGFWILGPESQIQNPKSPKSKIQNPQNPAKKAWILEFGDFGFWILGILDFWDFGDFGFWIVGILDFGFWGFWILGILGFWGFWILDFGDFGFWIFGTLCSRSLCAKFGFWNLGILDFGDFGFWGFWILDFGDLGFWILDWGFWMGTLWQNFGCYIRKEAVHADPGRRIWSCDDCHQLYAFLVTSTVVHLKFLGQSAAPPSGHGVATTHDTTPLGTDPGCTWPLSCSSRFLNVHDHPKRFFLINSTVEILMFFEQPLRFCQYQNRRYAGLPLPTTCGSASGEGAEFERIF